MLTPKHYDLLRELRDDARLSLAEVSRRTGIASSTIFDYYQQLAKHAILRHVTIPDFASLGYPLHKKFLLQAKDRKASLAWLKAHSLINNLYRVDAWSAFFDAHFQNVNEFEIFKEEIQRSLKPQTLEEFDVLEELKHESFIPTSPRGA